MLNLCSTMRKKNIEYKKIKLRDFRHNLTQLKDSLLAGEVYEVTEKGSPIAYFIPAQYKVAIKKEKKELTAEIFEKILAMPTNKINLPEDLDVDKEYLRLLEEKYLKK